MIHAEKQPISDYFMPYALDRIDQWILAHLQKNGAATATQVGAAVGLSQSPCWRRIRRLEEDGVIKKRVALLDRQTLGLGILVFAHVKLEAHGGSQMDEFRRQIESFDEVMECYVLMGPVDFLLRIVVADMAAYERFFFDRLSQLPAVREVNSMIAVSTVKETTALPLRP